MEMSERDILLAFIDVMRASYADLAQIHTHKDFSQSYANIAALLQDILERANKRL